MISENKLNILQELISSSSKEEIIWINGYLNGLVSGAGSNGSSNGNGHSAVNGNGNVSTVKATKRISIVYGTETGNAKKLALQFTAAAKKNALLPKCTAMETYRPEDLAKEEYLFIIVSTHGEGEPPENARKFYQFLHTAEQQFPRLRYSVLALGDSSYPLFCKTGEDIDLQLKRLGGTALVPLQKCDVDFEDDAAGWFEKIVKALALDTSVTSAAVSTTEPPVQKKHTKKHFEGRIIRSVNLNDSGSTRSTWHIELRTEEDMDYEPGDSIAIVPANRPEVVERILSLAGVDGTQHVVLAKVEGAVRDLLTSKLNICYLLGSTVRKYASLSGHEIPEIRMDLVDLLRIYPLKNDVHFSEVLALLHPIAPRLYSVSSSAKLDAREVHITVSLNRFMKEDEQHYGLCSRFLGDLPEGSLVPFYIHRNRSFKLPAADKDIIMIGPGTGIAPFRSFLQERDADGSGGRNWLFLGERHFTTDFFYQTEIQQYHQTGLLQKVNVAFSRDGAQKLYVQHRMQEHGAELFSWLQQGAHFYVSGSKHPMSIEVEETLLNIIAREGNMDEAASKAYLEQMKKEGRYQKDVY